MSFELGKSAKVSTTLYHKACDISDNVEKVKKDLFKSAPKHEIRVLISKTIHQLLELYKEVKGD